MEENNMKLFVFILTCVAVSYQSFSQDIGNRYVKETLDDISNTSSWVGFNHRLSYEKDKQYLSKDFVYNIPLYMENILNKCGFKDKFFYNLSRRFEKERLIEISASIQALSFKLDIYNELYDINIITKEDKSRDLTEDELDIIIGCLSDIKIDFDAEKLEQEVKEGISKYKRPFGVYTFGNVFWENIHALEKNSGD